MTNRNAILAAIISNPGDDMPRLIFADFLEENGEAERAAFIRVQVELARLPAEVPVRLETASRIAHSLAAAIRKSDPHHEQRQELRRRERELFKNVWKWIPENFSNVEWSIDRKRTITRHHMDQESDHAIDFDWSCGFISRVELTWQTWLEHSPALHWRSGETMECPGFDVPATRNGVDGTMHENCWTITRDRKWWPKCKGGCSGTGRTPRPFVNTAQPIETVRLIDHPLTWTEHHRVTDNFYVEIGTSLLQFFREKCATCNGRGHTWPPHGDWTRCNVCHAQPLNSWSCDRWKGVRFIMPNQTAWHEPTHGTGGAVYVNGERVGGITSWEVTRG